MRHMLVVRSLLSFSLCINGHLEAAFAVVYHTAVMTWLWHIASIHVCIHVVFVVGMGCKDFKSNLVDQSSFS